MTTLLAVDESMDAPDLLRRFVPTPYQAMWTVDSLVVMVESNAEEILGALPQVPPESRECRGQQLRLRAILDPDINIAENSPSVIWDSEEILVGRTPKMLFAVDRKAAEACIFIREFVEADFRALIRGLLPTERQQ